MTTNRLRPARRRPRGSAGFSVVEVLIASALLLLIAVGVLPLFSRSLVNNLAGNDATQTNNAAVNEIEDLNQERFVTDRLTWTGAATERVLPLQYQIVGDDYGWLASVPSGATAQYTRRTTVRQYQVTNLIRTGSLGAPLPGSATPGEIQIRELTVVVTNERAGATPRHTARQLKGW